MIIRGSRPDLKLLHAQMAEAAVAHANNPAVQEVARRMSEWSAAPQQQWLKDAAKAGVQMKAILEGRWKPKIWKRRGRPPGRSVQARMDKPLYDEMRALIYGGKAPSITAAAMMVQNKTDGPSITARVTRLRRGYVRVYGHLWP
jgi:hypothetical protein